MTPEQLSALTAISALLKSMSTWPVVSLLVMGSLAPWVIMIFLSINQYKRVEAQAKMYEDNVELVKKVIALAEGYREHLIWSTQAVTRAVESAETNQFCPIVRRESNPKDIRG